MPRLRALLLVLALPFLAAQTPVIETGRATGLPLPRFVSTAGNEVNVRSGPGRTYPIRWVYAQIGVPVKIVEESEDWRRIEDFEGDGGWVLASLLSSRRTILVTGETRPLRRSPRREARIVLWAEPNVIGRLLGCEGTWCRVEIADQRGWLERGHFFGALEIEPTR